MVLSKLSLGATTRTQGALMLYRQASERAIEQMLMSFDCLVPFLFIAGITIMTTTIGFSDLHALLISLAEKQSWELARKFPFCQFVPQDGQ